MSGEEDCYKDKVKVPSNLTSTFFTKNVLEMWSLKTPWNRIKIKTNRESLTSKSAFYSFFQWVLLLSVKPGLRNSLQCVNNVSIKSKRSKLETLLLNFGIGKFCRLSKCCSWFFIQILAPYCLNTSLEFWITSNLVTIDEQNEKHSSVPSSKHRLTRSSHDSVKLNFDWIHPVISHWKPYRSVFFKLLFFSHISFPRLKTLMKNTSSSITAPQTDLQISISYE